MGRMRAGQLAPTDTAKALQAGKVAATIIGNENRLRLSVSVFNTHEDIDRVVAVLGGRRTSSVGI